MNDLHKDIVCIDSAVKLKNKILTWALAIIIVNLINFFVKSDFWAGFLSVILPFGFLSGSIMISYCFSGNNYILMSTLPIKQKNIPRIMFLTYEFGMLINFIGISIISLIQGSIFSVIKALILVLVSLIFGYIAITSLSSTNLQENCIAQGDLKTVALISSFTAIFILLNTFFSYYDEIITVKFFVPITVIIIAFLAVISIISRRICYDIAYKKIRGIYIKKQKKRQKEN